MVSLVILCGGTAIFNIAASSRYRAKTEYERMENRYIAESGIDLAVGLFINYLSNQDYVLSYTQNGDGSCQVLDEYSPYLLDEIKRSENVDSVIISSDRKEIKIKQRGSESYSLNYTIAENYPVDYLAFKGKRLIDIECDGSSFSFDGKAVVVKLQILKNNIQLNQAPQEVSFEVVPQSNSVVLEIND